MLDYGRDGAEADYTIALPGELAPKPRTLDYVQAAAVPLSALTAWQGLFEHASLVAGQTVLIHGGAGGVGVFAVQLARLGRGTCHRDRLGTQSEFLRRTGSRMRSSTTPPRASRTWFMMSTSSSIRLVATPCSAPGR